MSGDCSEGKFFSVDAVEEDGKCLWMFGRHWEESKDGSLLLSLCDGRRSWKCKINSSTKTRVASTEHKSLGELVKALVGGEISGNVEVKLEGGKELVFALNGFRVAELPVQEVGKDEQVLRSLVCELLARNNSLIELKRKGKEMEQTIDDLQALIEERVNTEMTIQDELGLQFLQVLNSKKAYAKSLLEQNKLLKQQIQQAKQQTSDHSQDQHQTQTSPKPKPFPNHNPMDTDDEHQEDEEDPFLSQFD